MSFEISQCHITWYQIRHICFHCINYTIIRYATFDYIKPFTIILPPTIGNYKIKPVHIIFKKLLIFKLTLYSFHIHFIDIHNTRFLPNSCHADSPCLSLSP